MKAEQSIQSDFFVRKKMLYECDDKGEKRLCGERKRKDKGVKNRAETKSGEI